MKKKLTRSDEVHLFIFCIMIFLLFLTLISVTSESQTYETVTKDNEVSRVEDVVLKVTTEKQINTTLKELYKEKQGILLYRFRMLANTEEDLERVDIKIEAALLEAQKIVLNDPNAKAEEIEEVIIK